MSKQIQEQDTRVSFTAGDVSADEMDAAADALGYDSRAEFVRAAVREKAAQAKTADASEELARPDHDDLDAAYETLLALSQHPRGTRSVSVDAARDELYGRDCPKDAVVDRLLRPLADDGFIDVSNGRIHVRRHTVSERETVEQAADESFARLETARDGPMRSLEPPHNELLKYRHAGLDVPFRLTAWVAGEVLWGGADV